MQAITVHEPAEH